MAQPDAEASSTRRRGRTSASSAGPSSSAANASTSASASTSTSTSKAAALAPAPSMLNRTPKRRLLDEGEDDDDIPLMRSAHKSPHTSARLAGLAPSFSTGHGLGLGLGFGSDASGLASTSSSSNTSASSLPLTHETLVAFDAPSGTKKVKTQHQSPTFSLDARSRLEGPYAYVPYDGDLASSSSHQAAPAPAQGFLQPHAPAMPLTGPRRPMQRTDSSSSNPFHPASQVASREAERQRASARALPALRCTPAATLELPAHYRALEQLHAAVEAALVQHFATASNLGPVSTRVAPDGSRHVELARVLTYSELALLVRQRRALGKAQLAQLAWLWSAGEAPTAPHAEAGERERAQIEKAVSEVRGLGFVVKKVKARDPRTGKDIWDLGLGLELSLHRPKREATPPMQVGYLTAGPRPDTPSTPKHTSTAAFDAASPPQTPTRRDAAAASPALRSAARHAQQQQQQPPSSPSVHSSPAPATPSRPSRRAARVRVPSASDGIGIGAASASASASTSAQGASVNRDQMNISTMWNNGIERRKAEVARRLRERAAQHYEAWARAQAGEDEDEGQEGVDAQTSGDAALLGLGIAGASSAGMQEPTAQPASTPPRTPPRTPQKPSHTAVVGHGGLLTPSATRSPDHKPGVRRLVEAAGLAGEASSSSTATQQQQQGKDAQHQHQHHAHMDGGLPLLHAWPQGFDIDSIPPVPQAALPSLREERKIKVPSLSLSKLQSVSPDSKLAAPAPPPPPPASTAGMTPSQREDAMRARLAAKASGAAGAGRAPPGSAQALADSKERAILSRLPRVGQVLVGFFPQKANGPAGRYEKKKSHEVIAVVKQALGRSSDEDAAKALEMVRKAAPGFLTVENVPGQGPIYARIGRPALSSQDLQKALRAASTGSAL